jgi:hypothetical protein
MEGHLAGHDEEDVTHQGRLSMVGRFGRRQRGASDDGERRPLSGGTPVGS